MKRRLVVGTLFLGAIFLVTWLVLPRLVDVERHRPALERAIGSATGRSVSLAALELRLLPLPVLRAKGLRIGEDEAFGGGAFLEARKVEIRVRLWPLLSRTLSVVSLTIEEPEVRVVRNAEGRWNVLTLGPGGGAAAAGGPAPSPARGAERGTGTTSAEPESGAGFTFLADRVRLVDGRLTLLDAALVPGQTRTTKVEKLDCTLTDLSMQTPVGIDLGFDLEGVGRLRLAGHVGPLSPQDAGTLPLELRFGVSASQATLSGKLSGLHTRPAIDAHLAADKAALPEIFPLLRLLGPMLPAGLAARGQVTLDATLRGPLDDPARASIEGSASVAGLELSDPRLRKPITAIHGALALAGDRATIDDFGATLGASSVTGSCTLTSFAHPTLALRLASSMLDVDELLSLLVASAPVASSPPAALEGGRTPARAAPDLGVPGGAAIPTPAPSATELTLLAELAVARAKVLNLALANAHARLELHGNEARLGGITVELYGGRMAGDLTARVAESGPPFTLSARLQGVDFGALAADFSKDLAGRISGTLETTLEVRGRGVDSPALRRDLAGHGTLQLRDGSLSTFGVLKLVSRALEAAGGRGIGTDATPFRSLSGTFEIAGGRARTEDLTLDSADLALHGKGSLGLDLSIDLRIGAVFSPAVSADMLAKTASLGYLADREGRLALDLTARGSLDAPSIGVDRGMIDRAARGALEQKLREKGKSLLEKLLEKKKRS